MDSAPQNRASRIMSDLPAVIILGVVLFNFYYFLMHLEPDKRITLEKIRESGELVFITRNNVHSYYRYRDVEMGFEYDLARAYADYLGVRLKVEDSIPWKEMPAAIDDGRGAIIGANYSITSSRGEMVSFSLPYMETSQHIIVGRGNREIKSFADLKGKTVYIRSGTSYKKRLESLQGIGDSIRIIEIDEISTEDLIGMVNRGNIDITMADDNIVRLSENHYPRIKVALTFEEKARIGWAVHPKSRMLQKSINAFLAQIKRDGTFQRIYDRYYKKNDTFAYFDLISFHKSLKRRLPKYEDFIKKYALESGFDWRMVAAQIYQESHFKPEAQSHAKAAGLMQLMEKTALSYGVSDAKDPEQNIRAGVKHLKMLYDRFSRAMEPDRTYIALAAYNVGQGHISDAMKLAVKQGLDPYKWRSLEKTLRLLSKRKYYKNSKYGYCRGSEPVKYVSNIMEYYDIIKHRDIQRDITSQNDDMLSRLELEGLLN